MLLGRYGLILLLSSKFSEPDPQLRYLLPMPAKHLPTSSAMGSFLRDQRKRLGYTLRDVEERSAAEGKLIPFSTLARIEQGKLDPGVRRLQQLLRVYHVPLQAAGDLLDLEEFAGELPKEKDPKKLYEMGANAWHTGDPRKGLAAFLAMQRLEGDVDGYLRQQALHALSCSAAQLGKYEFAKHIVDGLLLEPPDDRLLIRVLVQAARCWQWLGGLEVALALLERARVHLSPASPPYDKAFVFHLKASIHIDLKQYQEAEQALAVAEKAYRKSKDETGFSRALGTRVRIGFERGDAAKALLAAQAARLYAQRHGFERLRMLYSIEEAHAYLLLGNVTTCLSRLGQVLADAVGASDDLVRFYTHFYFWKAYETLGDEPRAEVEFETAARYLEGVDEVGTETREVRERLAKQRGSRARGARTR